jgi:sugar-specific transcriptional regulator TrmB
VSVFLSYASEDRYFAQRLYRSLESARKGPVWDQDPETIRMSERWRARVKEAIESSDKFILVISPDSVVSEPCAYELDQAIELGKQVITILRRDPGPLPPETDNNKKMIDAVREIRRISLTDDAIYDTALDKVIEAIDTDLERGEKAFPPTHPLARVDRGGS